MAQNQRKAIFFGNGLNRINEEYPKWEELLTKAAERFFESKEGLVVKGVPCPFMYESMYFLQGAKGFDSNSSISPEELNLKQAIADGVKEQKVDAIYAKLAAAPVSEYITTNIDTNLETALDGQGYNLAESDSSEIRYSIHRYKEFINSNTKDKKRIWYIHGNADKPSSIIFGYEQYGGQLSRIASYVNGSYKFGNMHPAKMEDRLNKLKDTGDFHVSSWIDLFFIADVHILGFGLDFSEIDIWWLLDKRKRLLQERLFKNRNDLSTSIHFYKYTKEKEQASALYKLLTRFDVDVVNEKADKYRRFYNNIIGRL